MNIMILRDRKGFEKVQFVPRFLPEYYVATPEPLSAHVEYVMQEIPNISNLTIKFFPSGEPIEVHGDYILIYNEQ